MSQLTQSAGPASSFAFAPPEINSTTPPTIASPMIQPSRNAGALAEARGVPSISTTPMMGTGLSATPTASGNTSPMA